jgi:hypothetical protein
MDRLDAAISKDNVEDESSEAGTNTLGTIGNQKDEKLVVFSRVVVIAVLAVLALITASTTYHNISRDDRQDFQTEVSRRIFDVREAVLLG